MTQLELPWRNEDTLRNELERHTGMALSLTITDNTSTMLSMRRDRARGGVRIRAHRMFLSADPKIVRAMADWLTRPRANQSGAIIDRFIKDNQHRIRMQQPRASTLRTEGRFFELQEIFDDVNATVFDGQVDAAIAWGRMPSRKQRRRRSIRFGSYTQEDHLVRVHPLLDQDFVPPYVVRYIVFHEMLHAFVGVEVDAAGRRRVHTPEFRRLERAYPDYDRAVAWLEDPRHLARLLKPGRAA